MIILKIKNETVGKAKPLQSNELGDGSKFNIEVGELKIEDILGIENNHLLVKQGDKEFYIWMDHLDINGVIIIRGDTFGKLTNNPIDSSSLKPEERIVFKKGNVILPDEILEHRDNHIRVKDITGKKYWLFIPHLEKTTLPDTLFEIIQLDKLVAIVGNRRLAERHHQAINITLAEFNIDTYKRITCFLAQVLHESGGLKWVEEIASGKAYEGRKDLGNIYKGDGVRFKGRGLIQLTGRHNYSVAGKALGLDLINLPHLASNDENGARIAGWYWDSRGLNRFADQFTTASFEIITRRINGGLNGWKDRLKWWDKCKKILK